MVENNHRILTQLEDEYLIISTKFFESFYHTETEARILALLQLKARSREESFSQKELMAILGKSKATISRTLNSLFDRQRCKYFIEEKILESEGKKKVIVERKYYTEQNFRDILITRMTKYIEEFEEMENRIEEIRGKINNEKPDLNKSLKLGTEEFIQTLRKWIETYQTAIKIFKGQ
ncbi:MAG: hypothetical protein ACFFD1_03000 [Candidatus Thorarchaeota archaeon]